jgi:hypothetical protein
MVRHHSRKTQRKQRQQRKNKKQQSRRNRKQRGGSSCSAMPLNRELFAQRGGMAPFGSLDNGYLIDQAARVQAETYPLDQAINELPSVIVKAQQGGKRQRKSRKQKQSRSQRQSRKQRQQRQQRRNQRGGMYPIDADTMLLPRSVNIGASPQFSNEAQVNNLYNEYSGPQGPHTRV